MATPHIAAEAGAFAETILLPGDPLRAQWIAEEYLDSAVEVTAVRNILGYTGTFDGKPISVMGTGMGIPSVSIYATELVRHFGVRNLVRIGSCGAITEQLDLGDLVIGIGACTDSGVNRQRFGGFDFAAVASYELLDLAVQAARRLDVAATVGTILTSDLFYTPAPEFFVVAASMGVLAVEMEAAGLYGVAAETGTKALCICTVSDHIVRHEALTAEERQNGFAEMVELALEAFAR